MKSLPVPGLCRSGFIRDLPATTPTIRSCAKPQLYPQYLETRGSNGMPSNSHNLRKGRYCEPERIYLLTTVTRHRQPLFNDFHLGRLLVNELRSAHEQQLVASLAWVVMPDHLHWLIQLGNTSLEQLMKRVKARSALAINRAQGTTGALWQAGFHDRAARQEEDIQQIARYVLANPLRAGLIERLADYPLWDAIWL